MAQRKTRTPLPVRRGIRDIGGHLAAWRRIRGLTAQQVAERAGVSVRTLGTIESGAGSPSLENVLRVARALGSLDRLVEAIDPFETDIGRLRSQEQLPRRIRRSKQPGSDDG